MESEKIICKICGKESIPSEEFPDWCDDCVEKYGDYDDEQPYIDKIYRKRSKYDG